MRAGRLLSAEPSPAAAMTTEPAGHIELVRLFADWRAFNHPAIVAGRPDYSAVAMAAKATRLPAFRRRLAGIDRRGFTASQTGDTRLVEAEMNGFWQVAFSGTLEPNPKGGSISIPFPEALARRLRLQVIDASNTPLTISNPRFAVVRREILFRMPAKAEMPLYLYTGNPQAQSPNYDIKTQLSPEDIATTTVIVHSAKPNPAYVPPPVAWSEQHPRLIDGVLAFASLVLAAILATLARAAIRRQEPPKAEVA